MKKDMQFYREFDWNQLYSQYKEGISLLDLSYINGIAPATISRHFKKNGFVVCSNNKLNNKI